MYYDPIHAKRFTILERPNSLNLANSATPSSVTMVLHILEFHRPNFEENGRIFDVSMNSQTFSRAKQEGDRQGERELRINLKITTWERGRGKRENSHN